MLSAVLLTMLLSGGTQQMMVPEGTILPVILNETISTAKLQNNDPILFTLADDVRSGGPRGPILIPRGSNVVGRAVKSERAGHLIGRAEVNIRIQEIITPSGEVYDGLSTKVVDVGKAKGEKGEVKANGEIQGPTHRKQDAFLLLFPPTTIFQLMATPERGPDVVIPVETRLFVKLMNPIYAEPAMAMETAAPMLPLPQAMPSTQGMTLRMSARSIEILVTPVALYPDAILRNVFIACTHPMQIVQANQWLQQSGNGYGQTWDASVRALTGQPDLLRRLGANIDWATNLGSAFRSQQADVMSAVQRLRNQASNSPGRIVRPIDKLQVRAEARACATALRHVTIVPLSDGTIHTLGMAGIRRRYRTVSKTIRRTSTGVHRKANAAEDR